MIRWCLFIGMVLFGLVGSAEAAMVPMVSVSQSDGLRVGGVVVVDDWEDEEFLATHIRVAPAFIYAEMGLARPRFLDGVSVAVRKLDDGTAVFDLSGDKRVDMARWDLLLQVDRKILLFPIVNRVRSDLGLQSVSGSVVHVLGDNAVADMDEAYRVLVQRRKQAKLADAQGQNDAEPALGGSARPEPQVFALKARGGGSMPENKLDVPVAAEKASASMQGADRLAEEIQSVFASMFFTGVASRGDDAPLGVGPSCDISETVPTVRASGLRYSWEDFIRRMDASKTKRAGGNEEVYESRVAEASVEREKPRAKANVRLGGEDLDAAIKEYQERQRALPLATYRVRPGESLLVIAARLQLPFKSTVDQRMLALFRANPQAFTHENMNSLMAGAILDLRIGLDDMVPPARASAIVDGQYEEWQKKMGKG